MRRREFVIVLAGAGLWSLDGHAQQSGIPVIGFLSGTSPDAIAHGVAGFHQGLKDGGYVEASNVAIDYRWANGRYDLLPSLAAELVARNVAVVAAFGPPAALAMKAATTTIPFVFTTGGDVIRSGLVASLNRPGGNATGVNLFTQAAAPKRLELTNELVPGSTKIGFLLNPQNPASEGTTAAMQRIAQAIKRELYVVRASSESEIETAFTVLVRERVAALIVNADPFFDERQRGQLVGLSARHAIPTVYGQSAYVRDGGLISYGTSIADAYRQVGFYVARILKGEKPSDLPVLQPSTFELVINLKTALALGLTIPPSLLARADEVIE
jgi:putative tryptophan/tyrosine transport system substrate-binding protein